MKIGKILLIVLLLVVLAIAALFGMNYMDRYQFEGTEIKVHNVYQLDFVRMNKTDEHILQATAGSELAVSFDIRQGTFDMTISMGDDVLYRGNKIDAGSFKLPIETEGDCRIEVKGSNARGSLEVMVQKTE